MGQLLPEDQALRFHQHLPEREREGAVLVCERDLIKEVICQSNVNLKMTSFTVTLSGRLPLSPKMAGERDDTRDFNLSSGGSLGGCSVRGRWPHSSPWSAHIYRPLPCTLLDSCSVDSPIHHRCNHYSLSHKPTAHPAKGVYCTHGLAELFFGERIH